MCFCSENVDFLYRGGRAWPAGGGHVWLPGGRALLPGGMRGCRGGVCVAARGACVAAGGACVAARGEGRVWLQGGCA